MISLLEGWIRNLMEVKGSSESLVNFIIYREIARKKNQLVVSSG